jgi:hypothetical protein
VWLPNTLEASNFLIEKLPPDRHSHVFFFFFLISLVVTREELYSAHAAHGFAVRSNKRFDTGEGQYCTTRYTGQQGDATCHGMRKLGGVFTDKLQPRWARALGVVYSVLRILEYIAVCLR